jgi:hypothetical protein
MVRGDNRPAVRQGIYFPMAKGQGRDFKTFQAERPYRLREGNLPQGQNNFNLPEEVQFF